MLLDSNIIIYSARSENEDLLGYHRLGDNERFYLE